MKDDYTTQSSLTRLYISLQNWKNVLFQFGSERVVLQLSLKHSLLRSAWSYWSLGWFLSRHFLRSFQDLAAVITIEARRHVWTLGSISLLRLDYTFDASTSISISTSISNVWTGTTQAQAQEKAGARSFFLKIVLASSRFTIGLCLYLCSCLCLRRTCKPAFSVSQCV